MTILFDLTIVLLFGTMFSLMWKAGASPVVFTIFVTVIFAYILFIFKSDSINNVVLQTTKYYLKLFLISIILGVTSAKI